MELFSFRIACWSIFLFTYLQEIVLEKSVAMAHIFLIGLRLMEWPSIFFTSILTIAVINDS
jgi:hypothetical protein